MPRTHTKPFPHRRLAGWLGWFTAQAVLRAWGEDAAWRLLPAAGEGTKRHLTSRRLSPLPFLAAA